MTVADLTGCTIVVTRAAGQSDTFVQQLQDLGAHAVALPALDIQPPSSWDPLDEQLARLTQFDWVILTSANGVEFFFRRLVTKGWAIAALSGIQIAVVGRKTALCLEKHGLKPDYTPPQFISESLVEHFPDRDNLTGTQILYPCLEAERRELLITELSQLGATVVDVPAYRSVCPTNIAPDALAALRQGVDVITFASPKTARYFYDLLVASQDRLGTSPEGLIDKVAIAAIGPLTAVTCREVFGRVDLQPQEYSLNGLAAELVRWYPLRA